MNELMIDEKIENLIYEIRGKQVMFDSDLARLYNVETKRINEAVKNNPLKFPERFSWILTKDEMSSYSRSKNSTLNNEKVKRGENIKYLPRVFTKQDISKYNKQYSNLRVIYDNTFHDRYFLLDNDVIYHCGTSINRIGHKTFSITLLSDDEVLKILLKKVNIIID